MYPHIRRKFWTSLDSKGEQGIDRVCTSRLGKFYRDDRAEHIPSIEIYKWNGNMRRSTRLRGSTSVIKGITPIQDT